MFDFGLSKTGSRV